MQKKIQLEHNPVKKENKQIAVRMNYKRIDESKQSAEKTRHHQVHVGTTTKTGVQRNPETKRIKETKTEPRLTREAQKKLLKKSLTKVALIYHNLLFGNPAGATRDLVSSLLDSFFTSSLDIKRGLLSHCPPSTTKIVPFTNFPSSISKMQ
ncbi:hypothetical protein V6N11_007199 [Hibiscus sabdariffa]|uniref:Uncharacterized protein n=1 Tax=Hibiscus sabdariffa TaxID=183260 RepID=A0ABR2RTN7_9ROSI